MTGLSTKLADHLVKRQKVADCFNIAHLRLVKHILENKIEFFEDAEEPEWRDILMWASIFGQSESDDHVEIALIGAVSALVTASPDSDVARDAATIVLESASNFPTINLAIMRGILPETSKIKFKIPALVRSLQLRLQHLIFDDLHGTTVPVTSFQERSWAALEENQDAALSAPTSAGKSFILLRWLIYFLCRCEHSEILAYIVPSRALISQVSRNIADECIRNSIKPQICTMPTLFSPRTGQSTILVMTQERLERLFSYYDSLSLRVLVIDEAHKLGEGSRGVILQRVIDESLRRSSNCRIILAAPHANNAETLLPREGHAKSEKLIEAVVEDAKPTVLQNLLWVTQKPRRRSIWTVEVIQGTDPRPLGELNLPGSPSGKKKQLAELAFHLGAGDVSNIVYANGPGEAENIAQLLSELFILEGIPPSSDPEINDLVRLIKDYIHPSYPLAGTLPYLVGIHYGDMPEIARREQERLFDEGKLAFLVCTSTLLEGVNLPCHNLFIWGPRQGPGRPMTLHAFWNLAGRAGRWGREFAGNIFCINVHNSKEWPHGAPTKKISQTVNHAGAEVLDEISGFIEFTNNLDPITASRSSRYYEQILGELVSGAIIGGGLQSITWIRTATKEQLSSLENTVQWIIANISAPHDLIRRHSSIHPLLISKCIEYFFSLSPNMAEDLMPMSPDMPDAEAVLSSNMNLCDHFLGSDFGNEKQRNLKSMVTIDWIRGRPIGRIIRDRIDYFLSINKPVRVPDEIRTLIKLINLNARYLIPKYLACYSDCILVWYQSIGRDDLVQEVEDIQDMLESGVAERTTLGLIGLGLSRTAAIEIASKIPKSDLSVHEIINWLQTRNLESYNLSPVIIREAKRALETTDFI